MLQSLAHAATTMPAPELVAAVALLVFFSVGGVPVPMTATVMLAGAVAERSHAAVALFLALTLALTAVTAARDVVVVMLSSGGARWASWVRARIGSRPPNAKLAAQIDAAKVLVATRWGWLALILVRLTPIASPMDIAAGVTRMPLRPYVSAIVPGRVLWSIMLLAAGALSGHAILGGASLPQVVAIVALVLSLVFLIPAIAAPRLLARWAAPHVG
jgi:membrane protein DedA with SNARE-associated domain